MFSTILRHVARYTVWAFCVYLTINLDIQVLQVDGLLLNFPMLVAFPLGWVPSAMLFALITACAVMMTFVTLPRLDVTLKEIFCGEDDQPRTWNDVVASYEPLVRAVRRRKESA